MSRIDSQAPRVTRAQEDHVRGVAPQGSLVRVVNASMAPFAGKKVAAATAHGYAGEDGRFSIKVPGASSGDWVHVGVAKTKRGPITNVVTVRLKGKDGRRAEFSPHGLRLVPGPNDTVKVHYVRKNRAICEPFANVKFTNQRTKTSVLVRLDAQGELPKDFTLPGRDRDLFSVRASDGKHDPSLRLIWEYLAVGRSDTPPPHPLHRHAQLKTYAAPLTQGGFNLADPLQGDLGNCGMVSLLAGTALLGKERLRKMVKKLSNGDFRVRFWAYDHARSTYVPHHEVVKPAFYANGLPLYTHTAVEYGDDERELWPLVIERAYAQWLGHYGAVQNIYLHTLFEAFFGVEGEHVDFHDLTPSQIATRLREALDQKHPTIVTTHPPAKRRFSGTGWVPDHAYTLVACDPKAATVTLRNPAGHTEPVADGDNDGVFTVPLAEFVRYVAYASVATLPDKA